jgi:hypothetical protein
MSEESPSALDGGAVTDRARLEAAVAACQTELAGTARASAPREWALLQIRLGEALQELARTYLPDDWLKVHQELHPQARRRFEAALEESEHLSPLDRAAARMQLGRLLSDGTNAQRAIDLCREAIGDVSRQDAPELWGLRGTISPTLMTPRGSSTIARPTRDDALCDSSRTRCRASVLALRALRPGRGQCGSGEGSDGLR